MRYLALLLAFCFVQPLWSAGGYLMDQKSKDESLRILSELELDLAKHKSLLIEAIKSGTRLDLLLTGALTSLEASESSLMEAKQKLSASETSLAEASKLLTQASQALKDSEQSLKDYQQLELTKMITVGVVTFLIGTFLF